MRKLKVGLISAWASRHGGGVFEALVTHNRILRAKGCDTVIFALDDDAVPLDRDRFEGATVVTAPVQGPRVFGYAPALGRALAEAGPDLLHLHGIWMYPSMAAAGWASASRRPYVISPHGMLDPWIVGRGRAKKALARLGYERRSWARADLFHALTEREAADIRRETGRDAIEVVANAVAPSSHLGEAAGEAPYLLYLGRIHSKKNVEALVEAWSRLDPAQRGDHRLLIAGWGADADVAALESRIRTLELTSVSFLGTVFGPRKEELLRRARYVVLPSFSEGLPMVILEAWAAGTPCIMTEGCNLPIGFEQGAALRTDTDVASIAAALDAALRLDGARWRLMSQNAGRIAAATFSPDSIGDRWMAIYERLARGPSRAGGAGPTAERHAA